MLPFMEDPNTGVSKLESDDIIKYLADTYGDGTVPIALRLGVATVLTAGLGTIPRCAARAAVLPDAAAALRWDVDCAAGSMPCAARSL
jgi:hypothetical protein